MLREKYHSGIFQDFELLFGCFCRVLSVSMLASLPLQLAKTSQKSLSKFPENISKQLLKIYWRELLAAGGGRCAKVVLVALGKIGW